jgi:membrane-bound lytic murein transglycosylase B
MEPQEDTSGEFLPGRRKRAPIRYKVRLEPFPKSLPTSVQQELMQHLGCLMKFIRFLRMIVLVLLFLSPAALCSAEDGNPSVQSLIFRLAQDGFDVEYLSRLFSDPRVELIPAVMTLSSGSSEAQDIYDPFLTPQSILFARKFLQANVKLLKQMESRFHVDKEVVVAILFVESRFGENIGRHRVLPTLASMALIDAPENLWNNYFALWNDAELSFESMEERARRKANWAYHELKCFLRMILDDKIDPLEVRGSYAGALGMAQFIPSTYLAYARTKRTLGDWLLSKEDAVFSIANYLKSHGWKRNITLQKKKQTLWYYNRSDPYVETILQIAESIK